MKKPAKVKKKRILISISVPVFESMEDLLWKKRMANKRSFYIEDLIRKDVTAKSTKKET